jgi:hypothetical protein
MISATKRKTVEKELIEVSAEELTARVPKWQATFSWNAAFTYVPIFSQTNLGVL